MAGGCQRYARCGAAGDAVIAVIFEVEPNRGAASRYFEIAQCFRPEEVHPEVREKLALLKFAFGVGPDPRVGTTTPAPAGDGIA